MEEWERERYVMVSRLPRYRRRLAEAEAAIRQAVDTCDAPMVSFSYGKDSLVCLDIARRIKPDILVVNIDRGAGGDLQEAVDLYAQYAHEHGLNYHRVKTPREILDIYREVGRISDVPVDVLRNNLIAGAKSAVKQFAVDCQITGLRSEESRARGYIRKYGAFHYSKAQKLWLCKPVLHWQGDEIWAYIVANDVPYIRYYDLMGQHIEREWVRYSNWAGVAQKDRGRFVWLRKYYPAEYELLASITPDVTRYA